MTTFGTMIPDPEEPEEEPIVVFVESADPVDLANKVNAVIAAMPFGEVVITNLTLSGAGDGHTFVVLIESVDLSSADGGLAGGSQDGILGTQVRCYLGGSDEELARARIAAGVPPSVVSGLVTVPFALLDEQMAGGAKGQRFMGMEVYSLASLPVGLSLTPHALANGVTQALGAGTTLLVFDTLDPAVAFGLLTPQEVQYTGIIAVILMIEASVSVTQDGAGDFTVAIVKDPLGTPVVVASLQSHTGAGETDSVTVLAYSDAFPVAILDTKFGILVTSGAGTSEGCQLRLTALPR